MDPLLQLENISYAVCYGATLILLGNFIYENFIEE